MIGRIVRSADFERVLRCTPLARTVHFALHHLNGVPTPAAKRGSKRESGELSTGQVPMSVAPVDDSGSQDRRKGPTRWLGMVIPKRHARRSVTRTLLKRRIRAAIASHEAALPAGLWVVRLRCPFDRTLFASAASVPLGAAAGDELANLLRRIA